MSEVERVHLLNPESQLKEAELAFERTSILARVTADIFRLIQRDPYVHTGELAAASGAEYHSKSFPELGLLVSRLEFARLRVGRAWVDFYSQAKVKGKQPGVVAFESCQPLQNSSGKVVLRKDESAMLAVVLEMGKADYQNIGGDAKSCGSYWQERNFRVGEKYHGKVPLIAIDVESANQTTLDHERAHAWHHQFVNTVIPEKEWWRRPEQVSKAMARLRRAWSKDPKSAEKSRSWDRTKEGVYLWARNEVIAMLVGGNEMDPLLERGGLYDYFRALKGQPDLYEKMWSEYEVTLKRELRTIEMLMKAYTESGWERRKEILPWMLMRWPLNFWTNSLTEIGIIEEMTWLKRMQFALKEVDREAGSPWFRLVEWFSGQSGIVEHNKAEMKKLLNHNSDELATRYLMDMDSFIQAGWRDTKGTRLFINYRPKD